MIQVIRPNHVVVSLQIHTPELLVLEFFAVKEVLVLVLHYYSCRLHFGNDLLEML